MGFMECRWNAGLTLRVVAKKMGVSYNAVHLWEKGKCWPKGNRLEQLAELYGVTVEQLVGLEGKEVSNDGKGEK